MIDAQTEQQLVQAAKKDLQSFAQLYQLYVKKIYAYVAYLVGNGQEAEDIVSETFERAMLHIDKFEYRGFSFGAWLYRIARNLVYDRSKKRTHVSLDNIEKFVASEDDDPQDIASFDEEMQIINKLLKQLKEEQQEIIYLRYVQKYSIQEVCDLTGKTEDSVKSLAKRGLAQLRILAQNYHK
jgi:RNA polymerase sigma-70 factor, ECF subfamily